MSAAASQQTGVLDNALWSALTGPQLHLTEGTARARRFLPAISSLVGVDDLADPQTWVELEALIGPGKEVVISSVVDTLPAGWEVLQSASGVQMVATDVLRTEPLPEAVVLGAADSEDMLALIARTQPGPFSAETYRLGTYLGVKRSGRLIAMAGERLNPPGWTEISAVCTDPEFQGQGLAGGLVRAIAHGVYARGNIPFLHAAATNSNAVSLYSRLGFRVRKTVDFTVVRSPRV